MAKSRRRTLKKRGGNKNWTFTNFVRQDVNTGNPPPPNAPQGPLGGRRRSRRRHRGGNPGGEYANPPYPSSPPTGPFKGGRKTRARRTHRGKGYY